MTPLEPFEIHRPVPAGKPNWVATATSVLMHLSLLALLILRPPQGEGAPVPPHQADGSEPQPVVTPLPEYVKPKPQAKPEPRVETPPPVHEQILGPDTKKPADIPHEAIAPHPPADPMTDPTAAPKAPDPVPVQPDAATTPPESAPTAKRSHFPTLGEMLATTNRLSPPRDDNAVDKALVDPAKGSDAPDAAAARALATTSGMGRSGVSNEDSREWRPSFPEAQGTCVDIPELGKNPDGSPVLANVIGYVYDADGRTPLPDAHLQILGTAFTTFTDSKGMYRLEFDPHLLARCRMQYVRVVAPGHDAQTLTLAIGRKVQSDDVHLRRH